MATQPNVSTTAAIFDRTPEPPKQQPPKPDPKKEEPPKSKKEPPPKPLPKGVLSKEEWEKQRAAQPRAGSTDAVVQTTNYSIAPGMAWFEVTVVEDLHVSSTSPLDINIQPRGSGQLLRQGLAIPLAVAVIRPTEVRNQWGPWYVSRGDQVPSWIGVNPYPWTWGWASTQEALAKLWLPAGSIMQSTYNEADLPPTGMSPQGFPGQPRQLNPAGGQEQYDYVMPDNIGINRAVLNTTTSPFELRIWFAGTGIIDKGTRMLAMTITGV